MRMRKGAPLFFALAALLGLAQAASASHCGALRFSSLSRACGDAQCCYSACQQQNRVCYKLVYDDVIEKRWHTCYKTVCETVNKQVCKTCYKEEVRYKDCHVTKYKTVEEVCMRNVMRPAWKEINCHEFRPQVEHCVKDVECHVRRCIARHCEKDCHYTVHCPVYEQHCHVHCGQVQKMICEMHCREECHRVCRPVTEACHKEVCCQVSRCVEEHCCKQVCVPCCKDVQEVCYKECIKRICEPVTTCQTVTRRFVECIDEPYDPCRPGGVRGLFTGIGLGRNNGCDPCATTTTKKNDCCDPCFDPCACKSVHLFDRFRAGRNNCCVDPCNTCCKSDPCCPQPTRKVWKVRCVTEQVPCTTYVTRCETEKVAYTVCKKVHYNEMRSVAYTVRRNVRGAYVDDKGVGHESEGPGRTFKECAVAKKLVPYTVTRMVSTIEKRQIPYSVTRCVRGAYVDDVGHGTHDAHSGKGGTGGTGGAGSAGSSKESHGAASSGGNNYPTDGPGRRFQEGAQFRVTQCYTTTRMVPEQRVRKVPYTVYENVVEKQIKKVPYQVCRMVPHCVTKKVCYQECVAEKYTVCKKVPYTECIQQPYTCRVAYQVTECVPCTVTKKVKYCVAEDVCVKKARLVAYDPGCPKPSCDNCCENRCGFLDRLRHWTNKCDNDKCTDFNHEGVLQRLFRNRFACEPTCNTGCTSGSSPATTAMTMFEREKSERLATRPPSWRTVVLRCEHLTSIG